MKKYTPSVKANNALKEQVVKEIKAFLYRIEKGKYDKDLDADIVLSVLSQLKIAAISLENAIGTGEENVATLASDALSQLSELKKQSEQSYSNRFESAADELGYTLALWKDALDGKVDVGSADEIEREKISRSRKKLNARLNELGEIKDSFIESEKRLEKEISVLEKDLAELDTAILNEENERKINDLYRNVKSTKSKIDMLTIRRSNYSACFNLLDMIYANAKEILQSSVFASGEIGKAKALLNLDRLKKVIVEPDKAIVILKRMEQDIKEIASRTATLDNKVFSLDSGSVQVSEDALMYKEGLMRKHREKEAHNQTGEGLEVKSKDSKSIKTEDN